MKKAIALLLLLALGFMAAIWAAPSFYSAGGISKVYTTANATQGGLNALYSHLGIPSPGSTVENGAPALYAIVINALPPDHTCAPGGQRAPVGTPVLFASQDPAALAHAVQDQVCPAGNTCGSAIPGIPGLPTDLHTIEAAAASSNGNAAYLLVSIEG